LVTTTHNGLSSFKQSSKWAFARSIPAPALPRISWAEDVPPAALGAFSPSSAAMHRTAPIGKLAIVEERADLGRAGLLRNRVRPD
jgi:hypothetical protein